MLFTKITKLSFGTFNKPTILQGLRSYKNSSAQSHLHDYVRNDQTLQKIKQQKIDYDFITKQSAGVLMFREFSFQQKTQETLIPHLNCEMIPTGAWTFEQIKKQLGSVDQISKTEEQNTEILFECEKDIQKAIQQYYTNVGKKNYQFNLSEEINKINQMTDEEFRHFANVLHGRKEQQTSKVPQTTNEKKK